MPQATVIQLFPISLYKGKMNIDDTSKNFVFNQPYKRMPSGNGDFSKNHYLLDLPEMKSLKDEIMIHVENYVYRYLNVRDDIIRFYIQNSWAVKHHPGDWAQNHTHSNCFISGVCYLKTEKNSGDITFTKPDGYTNLFHTSTRVPFFQSGNHNCEWWDEKPEDNDILLFPSHLMHHVKMNNSNEDRFSVAFNLNMAGILRSDDSLLDYLKLEEHKPKKEI
jgi:uncharacterized protein (TIGR02466 family)